MKPHKKIGAEFNLSLGVIFGKNLHRLSNKFIYLASGRDSLEFIIKNFNIKGGSVLLPAYLCKSVVKPFKDNKLKTIFYKVNENLEIDVDDLAEKPYKDVKALLVVHYFGVIQPNIKKISDICGKKNILLIEDMVQSSMTEYNPRGDVFFNSYRKIVPLPDGSLLGYKSKLGKQVYRRSFMHFVYVKTRLLGLLMNNICSLRRLSRWIYVLCEDKLIANYKKPARMSLLSKFFLRKQDFKNILKKRRENYDYLLKNIKEKGFKVLIKELPKNVCAFGFPIICEDREKIKQILIENKIYPPVHWELPKEISKKQFPVSYDVSESILTIPIDQRYNVEDMKRVVKVLENV
ncbi:DegT/DnrJ/EryC1/StrS aminotransferase family protein [Candidatus Woesearchaeota archaeon]|nr:DegT/DnrJ/EryC1/StrS aminotransferase family protein [Candidatus Woesearchaeota archaeon]